MPPETNSTDLRPRSSASAASARSTTPSVCSLRAVARAYTPAARDSTSARQPPTWSDWDSDELPGEAVSCWISVVSSRRRITTSVTIGSRSRSMRMAS